MGVVVNRPNQIILVANLMEHNHTQKSTIVSINRAFIIGIIINVIYVIIELAAGIYYNSLSLISDAGRNLSDVAALALALLAFRLAKVKANDKFTYGYRKSTILVSLINSLVLFPDSLLRHFLYLIY